MKLKAMPAVAEAGALTVKCVADPPLTAIVPLVPVIEAVTTSVHSRVAINRTVDIQVKV